MKRRAFKQMKKKEKEKGKGKKLYHDNEKVIKDVDGNRG